MELKPKEAICLSVLVLISCIWLLIYPHSVYRSLAEFNLTAWAIVGLGGAFCLALLVKIFIRGIKIMEAIEVKVIQCRTGEEVLENLRLSHENWNRGHLSANWNLWVFRGESNSKWKLLPKFFRPGIQIDYRLSPPDRGTLQVEPNFGDQIIAEKRLFYDFYHRADSVGLQIPGDSHFFRDPETRDSFIADNDWPQSRFLETLALAQHHGVPTRLIDFKYSPLVAAFFYGVLDGHGRIHR